MPTPACLAARLVREYQLTKLFMAAGAQPVNAETTPFSKPSVFVSYPFNPRDEWIRYCVPTLLRWYGCAVLSGENYQAQEINVAVTNDIARADLVIAFLTRRQRLENGDWVPSEWVLQEIGFARGKGIPVVLIREKGVYTQIGIVGNIQIIELDADREAFWVFPQLRAALRHLLFQSQPEHRLAVCHMAKRGARNRWDCWIWIDGSQESLELIAEVKYEFPKSFSPGKPEEGDPHRAFGDYADTDAPFLVKAKVRFKSGKKITVNHTVTLPGSGISQVP